MPNHAGCLRNVRCTGLVFRGLDWNVGIFGVPTQASREPRKLRYNNTVDRASQAKDNVVSM